MPNLSCMFDWRAYSWSNTKLATKQNGQLPINCCCVKAFCITLAMFKWTFSLSPVLGVQSTGQNWPKDRFNHVYLESLKIMPFFAVEMCVSSPILVLVNPQLSLCFHTHWLQAWILLCMQLQAKSEGTSSGILTFVCMRISERKLKD